MPWYHLSSPNKRAQAATIIASLGNGSDPHKATDKNVIHPWALRR